MPPNAKSKAKPTGVTVFAYQVGFGDCFLVRFRYPGGNRHVLIDFGTFELPKGAKGGYMKSVAADIKTRCGGKLDAIVATHRHKDHISGFATGKGGQGSGDIIASCAPRVVVQPWTEDPKAKPNARKPTRVLSGSKAFVAALEDIHRFAGSLRREAAALRAQGNAALAKRLDFLGGNNLKNRSAVENLMRMGRAKGRTAAYVHFGSTSGLTRVLPGVKVRVLGPPTLEQTSEILSQDEENRDEFWHLRADAASRLARRIATFRNAAVYDQAKRPPYVRWTLRRLRALRERELLQIVREMDDVLNNTSVILLFEVGSKRLLFPGDAQLENWMYALSRADVRKLLRTVNLYKVGHHGSLNATPKSLWKLFDRRSEQRSDGNRLRTVVSTKAGVHGSTGNKSEVPRTTLVTELEKNSEFLSTESLTQAGVQFLEIDIPVR
ncbi:MAG: hypothetical protein ACREON_05760 [Gemmatimonadaceae bacterium]